MANTKDEQRSDMPWGDKKLARPEMGSRVKLLSSSIGGSVDSGFVDHSDHVAEERSRTGSVRSFESDHSPDSLTWTSEATDQLTIAMKQRQESENSDFLKQTTVLGGNYSMKQTTNFTGMKCTGEATLKHLTRNIFTDVTDQALNRDGKQTIDLSAVIDRYDELKKRITGELNCEKQTRYDINNRNHHSSEQTTLGETDRMVRPGIQQVVAAIEPNGFLGDVTRDEKNKQSEISQFRAGVCTNKNEDECIMPTGNDPSTQETQFEDPVSETNAQRESVRFKGAQLRHSDHNMTNSVSELGVGIEKTPDEVERETKRDEPTKSITTQTELVINEDIFTLSGESTNVDSYKTAKHDTKLLVEESTFRNEGGAYIEEDDTIAVERVVTCSATPNGSIVQETRIVAETVEKMTCAPTSIPSFHSIELPVTERVMLKWPMSNGRFLRAIEDTDNPVLIIDIFRSRFRSQYCFTSETKYAIGAEKQVYFLKCFRFDFHGKSFYLAPQLLPGVCRTAMKFDFVRATREHVVQNRLSIDNSKFWFNFKKPRFSVLESVPFPDYYISLEKGARVLLRKTTDGRPDTRNFYIQIIGMQIHRQDSHRQSNFFSCFR